MAVKRTEEAIDRAAAFGSGGAASFNCSHVVRLSGRQWGVVGVTMLLLIALAPTAWLRVEPFDPGSDYRVPYELSNDYWLYQRFCRLACAQRRVVLVGDSVVWGHYVGPNETLAHHLNHLAGRDLFANLGLDGTHPAAMEGLLRHYGSAVSGKTVLLHLNPLWLSSAKHDLQTTKEFHFNHPELVCQFAPKIPCYKASFAERLRIAIRRKMPFSRWAAHMRVAYFQNLGLHEWTLEHPYENPIAALKRGLPEPAAAEPAPRSARARADVRKQDPAWVELDSSVQWRFFRRTIRLLQERDNDVFVLVGPFNEHMLTDENKIVYGKLRSDIGRWLRDNGIAYFAPAPLPAEHYVDASHPVGEGYALLADALLKESSFRSRMQGSR